MPNPPANRRLIWIVGLCAIGAVGIWEFAPFSAESYQLRVDRTEEPGSPGSAVIAVESGNEPRSATRRAAASTPEVRPEAPSENDRRSQLLRAFQELGGLSRRMPPNTGEFDFDNTDMSSLRKLVLEMEVEARELRGILDSAYLGDSNRPLVLAAFAYVKDARAEDREFLLAAVRSDLGEGSIGHEDLESVPRAASAFAGLFSLHMHGAEKEIEVVAEDLLERLVEPTARYDPLRDPAMFALAGLERVSSPRLLISLRSITTEPSAPLLTSAAWKSLGRNADANDLTAMLQQTGARNGHAREGLESLRDPAMSPVLEQMLVSGDRTVYSQYVAKSSARGLLSIDTQESLAAFERAFFSSDGEVREAASSALNLNPPTTALTTLLQLSARARAVSSEDPIDLALNDAIQKLRQRMERATVPHAEFDRTLRGVREALPRLVIDQPALRSALEVIALRGDEADRSEIARYMRSLPEADREVVREVWARENPNNPLW